MNLDGSLAGSWPDPLPMLAGWVFLVATFVSATYLIAALVRSATSEDVGS